MMVKIILSSLFILLLIIASSLVYADESLPTWGYVPGPTYSIQTNTSNINLVISGTGAGTVVSDPPGLRADSAIYGYDTASFSTGTTVVLSAIANVGSAFTKWGGDCADQVGNCTLIMNKDKNVNVEFSSAQNITSANVPSNITAKSGPSIFIIKTGNGYGTVTSSDGTINCGSICNASYKNPLSTTLRATPYNNSIFVGWTEGCSGSGYVCDISLVQGTMNIAANFSLPAKIVINNTANCIDKSGQIFYDNKGNLITTNSDNAIEVISPSNGYRITYNQEGSILTVTDPNHHAIDTQDKMSYAANGNKIITSYDTGGNEIIETTYDSNDNRIIYDSSGNLIIQRQNCQNTTLKKKNESPSLKIITKGNGLGVIISSDYSIFCGHLCNSSYNSETNVTLIEVPFWDSIFTGWAGACSSTNQICIVDVDKAKSVIGSFSKPSKNNQFLLSVQKEGLGPGAVFSYDNQIRCGELCKKTYSQNTKMTLYPANVDSSSVFVGWKGACTGNQYSCTITMDSDKNVSAVFNKRQVYFNLTLIASGGGSIIGNNGISVSCGKGCVSVSAPSELYIGSAIRLTATPSSGFVFHGWAGACTGNNQTCIVTMDRAKQVSAVFVPATIPLTVFFDGYGYIYSSDKKLSCTSSCKVDFPINSAITLLEGSTLSITLFTGWSGACNGNSSTCTINLSQPMNITAHFTPQKIIHNLSVKTYGPGEVHSILRKRRPSYGDISLSRYTPAVQIISDNKISCKCNSDGENCPSTCYFSSDQNDTMYLVASPNLDGSTFIGWTGACTGLYPTCHVYLNQSTKVTANFAPPPFGQIIVHNRAPATIVALNDKRINCGTNCSATYNSAGIYEIILSSNQKVIWKGCLLVDNSNSCIVYNKGRSEIYAEISPDQLDQNIKDALSETFANDILNYPFLKSFLTDSSKDAFIKLRTDIRSETSDFSVAGISAVISYYKNNYRNSFGIDAEISDYQTKIAKQALLNAFANEIASHPSLSSYLSDPNSKPLQTALVDLKAGRGGGTLDGLTQYIKQSKQWYIDATGIGSILNPPPPPQNPPPQPPIPSITSISPWGDRLTAKPIIRGSGFSGATSVTLGGNTVNYAVVSDSEIDLPDVKWGYDTSQNTQEVYVYTPGGYAYAPLVYNNPAVVYSASGHIEQCFGAVGPGCDDHGALGAFGKTYGCDSEQGGYRVCWVAPGSIRHDNCCSRHPSGKWCGGTGTDGKPAQENNHDGNCVDEWNAAFWDTMWGRAYLVKYPVGDYKTDLTPASSSPYNRYSQGEAISSVGLCMPSGYEIRSDDDVSFCCSGSASHNWAGKPVCN